MGARGPGAPSVTERLWARLDVGDCWLWTGPVNPKGYGRIGDHGHLRYVHRVAYEELVGPVPPGFVLDHLCRVPRCCNPSHMEVVTHRVNILRSPITIASIRAAQTLCIRGHELERLDNGLRMCRTCARQTAHDFYHSKKGSTHDQATL
jgi:hypothetical protein